VYFSGRFSGGFRWQFIPERVSRDDLSESIFGFSFQPRADCPSVFSKHAVHEHLLRLLSSTELVRRLLLGGDFAAMRMDGHPSKKMRKCAQQ
jgi:hypothetical protein